jgi:hypothetical protein
VYNRKKAESSWKTYLNVVRAHDRTQTKVADFGGKGDSASFEQAFSNLAHAYLRDSAPKLLDHEVGFQLLDRNRENTKAVGVFAFKVGSNWLYAPVFFLNGDLKGHELLYIKNQDMFVPLKENWINYLINRKPNILGSSVDKNLSALGQRQPDFTQLSRSPAKFGSAQPTLKEMMTAVMPTLAKCATLNTAAALADVGRKLDLAAFLKEARLSTINMLVKSFQDAPALAKAFDEFHGLGVIKEAIAAAKARDARPKIASVLSEAPKQPEAVKGLKVITMDVTTQTKLPPGHTEEDQEKLLRDGVLILDQRDRDNVSIPYQIQVEKKLFTPAQSGLYDILVKPGNIERCYVAVFPMGAAKRADFVTVVRTEGSPTWINTRADQVFAIAQVEGEEFNSWFNGLKDADSLPTGRTRTMLVGKNGDATCPLRVLREFGEDEFGTKCYEVDLEDYSKYPPKGHISACGYTDPLNYNQYRDGVRIHLNGKQGSSLRSSMGDIFVPEGFKLLKCAPGEDDKTEADAGDQGVCGCGESEPPPLMPGNLVDAQLALMQKTAALTVYHNGTEVSINKDAATGPIKALVTLVEHHGLREDAARKILKTAAAKRKFECRVKYADPYGAPMMVNDAPNAPTDPGPVMGGETIMGADVPTQMGVDIGMPVSGMSAAKTDRQIYNPNTKLDKRDINSVLQAAQSGQKEVFDTAMIGSMLRAVRDDSLVDRYMGEMTSGLDKLGRILFMFYWHGDRFADRYGKSDMPELEDSLRNAFEMLGDVILFLKQKTIEPYPEEQGTDVNLGSVANV